MQQLQVDAHICGFTRPCADLRLHEFQVKAMPRATLVSTAAIEILCIH